MNLAVDIGNTKVKVGVFSGKKMIYQETVVVDGFAALLTGVMDSYTIKEVIMCATGDSKKVVTSIEKVGLSYTVLSQGTPVPFKNLYDTPQSLGVDRIALMAGAVLNFPENNVLVIDAGTCITYDFKNAQEEYLGGAISPGVKMRYRAMHEYTHALPMLDIARSESMLATNTATAMHAGVFTGVVAEIDRQVNWYRTNYGNVKIVLTGGDAQFLSSSLKNDIFADSNFLLQGLNYILFFNTNQ
ncbi:MAG: pantothenate kinase [Cytophagaceae bacterium]|nr:pantothenate kinase [Cytophagaceae bacterium]|tara:strand:+ start:238 stop:966 length:729 start_codon:yes stop_codon:yes gene_type:complete